MIKGIFRQNTSFHRRGSVWEMGKTQEKRILFGKVEKQENNN